MFSGTKHIIFQPHFVAGMQTLSKMMLILATTEPGLGCCVILAHAQPIKLLVCEFLHHLPSSQAFKAFVALYYTHNFSSQATDDDAPPRNLAIIPIETTLLSLFV
jgi:hypothetical protein